jgi:hypothetical protein
MTERTPISLKEYLGNPDNQKRIDDRIAKRKAYKEKYTGKEWEYYLASVKKEKFRDDLFDGNAQPTKQYTSKYHTNYGDKHELLSYKATTNKQEFMYTEWYFDYCPACRKPINQYVVCFNEVENIVYIKHFVRNGQYETHELLTVQKKGGEITKHENTFNGKAN